MLIVATWRHSAGDEFKAELMNLTTGQVKEMKSFKTKEELEEYVESLGPTVQRSELQDPSAPANANDLEDDLDDISGDLGTLPTPPAEDAPPEEVEQYKQQLQEEEKFVGDGTAEALPDSTPPVESDTNEETIQTLEEDVEQLTQETTENTSNLPAPELPKYDGADRAAADAGLTTPALNFGRGKPAPPPGQRGMLGEPISEPVPNFNQLDDDTIIQGFNNTWIVLGRDRPGSKLTGYGAGLEPQTQAGAIDICVGRMSPHVEDRSKRTKKVLEIDPNFTEDRDEYGKIIVDAARVYISQKADIDDYFKIVDTKKGVGNIKTRSAVAMKADAVRIISRDGGIKLVTQELGKTNSVFSTPNNAKAPRGIDIIAGNEDKYLQPMVLGQNLVNFLVDLLESIDKIVGTVGKLESDLMTLSTTLMFHVHPQTGLEAGIPTAFSPEVAMTSWTIIIDGIFKQLFSIFGEKWDMNRLQNDYLRSGSSRDKAIMSKFNNVN